MRYGKTELHHSPELSFVTGPVLLSSSSQRKRNA
jgi:hypothetical protein